MTSRLIQSCGAFPLIYLKMTETLGLGPCPCPANFLSPSFSS